MYDMSDLWLIWMRHLSKLLNFLNHIVIMVHKELNWFEIDEMDNYCVKSAI